MDWGDVPRQLWRWVQAGQLQLPQNDVVLVDEAQFFAPIWFELIKRSLKPGTGYLFLVADPTQGFLKRRQSWSASGLEVRGRVHRLKKSYRTTREILNFATLLYRTRVPDDDDDIVPPDLLEMPGGAFPQIIPLTSEQDEITRVVNEIDQLIQQGIPKRHLLIIHTDWRGCDNLLERLRATLGPDAAGDPKERPPADAIRVSTLNAATGLESPIVFLVGAHHLFEQEQSIRLSDEERAELIRDNTRKLYMAITRAGQRLVMTFVGDLPNELRSLPIVGLPGA
jgi:superfamily I DNA/RNA helicase